MSFFFAERYKYNFFSFIYYFILFLPESNTYFHVTIEKKNYVHRSKNWNISFLRFTTLFYEIDVTHIDAR